MCMRCLSVDAAHKVVIPESVLRAERFLINEKRRAARLNPEYYARELKYRRDYHVRHRDAQLARMREYGRFFPEGRRERNARYRKAHPERVKAAHQAYRERHLEAIRKRQREWLRDKKLKDKAA